VCMCVCVCVSVCLSARISPERQARSLLIFSYVDYGRCSVLLRQGNEIPRKRGIFGVFFPTDNALYNIAFGTQFNALFFNTSLTRPHQSHIYGSGPHQHCSVLLDNIGQQTLPKMWVSPFWCAAYIPGERL